MKFQKALLLSALVLFGLTGCVQDKTAIIKVNDTVITKGEYQEALKVETSNPQYMGFGEVLKDENNVMGLMIKDRLVNELIMKAIIEQEIAKRNIEVTPDEIEKRKADIIEKLGSKEKLKELMDKNKISEKRFTEDITKEIKIDKLIAATKDTKVTDKEVKDYYTKNKAQFNMPERVRASHILIEVNPAQIKQEIISQDKKGQLTSEEINKKTQEILDTKMNLAKEIRAKVAADPKNFASHAKQYSDDKGTADKGGDLGFFTKEAMVKPFADVAFKLKPGVVSEVVVTDFGNHIIIVTDKAAAGVQPFDKMKDEIRAYLEQKKKIDVLKTLLDGLKASAKIEYVDPSYDLKNIQQQIDEKNREQQKAMEEAAKQAKEEAAKNAKK